jgi:hypothetical protein
MKSRIEKILPASFNKGGELKYLSTYNRQGNNNAAK